MGVEIPARQQRDAERLKVPRRHLRNENVCLLAGRSLVTLHRYVDPDLTAIDG